MPVGLPNGLCQRGFRSLELMAFIDENGRGACGSESGTRTRSTGPIATLSAASARAENLATRIDIHFADIESGQLDFELEIDERLAVM